LLAEEAAHEAVRLGALKAQSNAMRERLQLLAGLRLIPSLHVIRQDMDVRGWVMDFLTVLEEHEVPIEAVEAPQAIPAVGSCLAALEPQRQPAPTGSPVSSSRGIVNKAEIRRSADMLRAILARVASRELTASKRVVARLEGAATVLDLLGRRQGQRQAGRRSGRTPEQG